MRKKIRHTWQSNALFFGLRSPQAKALLALSLASKSKAKKSIPMVIRIYLKESERELVQTKATQAEMTLRAFFKYLALGTLYDPTLRRELLTLNHTLTMQGYQLQQLVHASKEENAPSQNLMAAAEALRAPLAETLYTIKQTLLSLKA